MSYLSPEFAAFFLLFLCIYWALGKSHRAQKISLLLVSYGLYAALDWRFALILLIYTTCMTALITSVIWLPKQRNLLTAIAIVGSVLNLAVFKYFDFFRESVQTVAASLDLIWIFPALDILLPVGISFYTFQAIAYIVSIRRSERAPANPLNTALYLAFFPTLLAGPICRTNDLLSQFESKEPRQILEPNLAFCLFLSAMIKKVWLASWIASTWVNPLFANPDAYQGIELMLGMYAYAIQIYFDFSGYSDLVIGMALLLGYRLNANFNFPYLARSLRDFWRRWHISLSSWIRDYVYIPMGGSHGSWGRTQVTIVTAMIISGIWHGASLKFIIWGAIHGFGMVLQNAYERWSGKKLDNLLSLVITFHFVCLAWVFFRADTWQDALTYLSGFTRLNAPLQLNVLAGVALLALFFIISVFAGSMFKLSVQLLQRTPIFVKPIVLTLSALVIHLLGPSGVPAFLYYSY